MTYKRIVEIKDMAAMVEVEIDCQRLDLTFRRTRTGEEGCFVIEGDIKRRKQIDKLAEIAEARS